MSELIFELVTPEGVVIDTPTYEVILPTSTGQISAFPHHIPLISIVVPGVISLRRNPLDVDDQLEHFATDGGLLEINGNRVRLLADAAEDAAAIDEQRAQEALERAQQARQNAPDQVTYAEATRSIERNLARLKVAELKKRRRR